MFDGSVPVELEKLKEIYRSIDQLSLRLGAFAADARREGLPASVQKRIDSLEEDADKIKELFEGVLTDDEQDETRIRATRPTHPWTYEE